MTGETADETEGVDCESRKSRRDVQVPIASDVNVRNISNIFGAIQLNWGL